MKIRAIILEDEEPARNLVKNYLSKHEDIEVIAEFADGFSGAKGVNELKPDLLFLDIQMPKLNGFEVLELLEQPPSIIFTTAFEQFAVQAFEKNATDYLLKPFSRERFALALQKARQQITTNKEEGKKIKNLIETIDEKPEILERVAVKSGAKIHVIETSQIIHIEADGDYVCIHTSEGKYLKEKTMKYFETHLDEKRFVRIHRSHIVNVSFINRLELFDKENYMVILKNNDKLRASASGYKLLKQVLNM